jgi:hypothetical protein
VPIELADLSCAVEVDLLGSDVRKALDSWDLAECDTSSMFNIGPLEATGLLASFSR